MSDLVGNPEDRFSRVAAPIIIIIITAGDNSQKWKHSLDRETLP